ncbi:hypothetical protein [Marinobacter confluentis]|uniref:Uncharacterized protein n=1 Tax=Marinobacter confluentis TaxID=1697557 RepID=A0A4Z1BZV5_9GAMM|nr:hypothetical protein [Marinobacter confluentis]TGN40268.1 hypothetical protein E5Q11_08270 [Marinobacter confluentis]
MSKEGLSALLSQHDLPASFIYLAPVLPIVQVMWADGRNQMPERAKLHCIIENHCKTLSELAGGAEIVSANDIERFDQAFIAHRPDPQVLEALTGMASGVIANRESAPSPQGSDSLFSTDQLFHACLEIAATCPAPEDKALGELFSQRIAKEERSLIEKTFELLQP